jgi:manganese/iron transport system ATP-binding protein/manganese/zinc/iron transport system ATP- binding protein
VTAPLVECTDVTAAYDGAPALEDVTFAAGAGERLGILGPNGGGKTTLFRVLAGELAPAAGQAVVEGRCGWVPQTERSRLDFPVSALDVALMGSLATLPWWRPPGRAERRRAREALAEVGMADLADATFGTLSGGQRQRVLIARALVQEASVLLLDEPFAGLDSRSADRLLSLIDELAAVGRTILIATHDLDQARAWDLVLCLNRRQVAFGHPAETLTREVLEATYGGAIVEIPGDGGGMGVLPPHHHDHEHSHDA